MLGVFRFTKTDITVLEPETATTSLHPDNGAVYLKIYQRFRHAVAFRPPIVVVSDWRASLDMSNPSG